MEIKAMTEDELGKYVCVPGDLCTFRPRLTITTDGVWVKDWPNKGQFCSAHRACAERRMRTEQVDSIIEQLSTMRDELLSMARAQRTVIPPAAVTAAFCAEKAGNLARLIEDIQAHDNRCLLCNNVGHPAYEQCKPIV